MPFLSSMKKIFFFHDATCETRTTCKILTFLEDLNFLNPTSHLNITFSKVLSSGSLSSFVSIHFLLSSNFSMPTVSLICLILYPKYCHQSSIKCSFFYALQSFPLIHDNTDSTLVHAIISSKINNQILIVNLIQHGTKAPVPLFPL